jgi:5'-phosphate synthase pdxT subunit
VLALQGDVREHTLALSELGCTVRPVVRPGDLDGLSGLVLPGGESTTLSLLLESTGLAGAVGEATRAGRLPILGTCAGMVLVARRVLDGRPDQLTFGLMDMVVRRNGYGRQDRSFETELELVGAHGAHGAPPLPAVFIRAPRVVEAGEQVEVLARVQGDPVLVRQGAVLATSFHPELTTDRRVHEMFVELCCAGAPCAGTSSPSPARTGSASSPPSPA